MTQEPSSTLGSPADQKAVLGTGGENANPVELALNWVKANPWINQVLIVTLGLLFCFWPLIGGLGELWFGKDSYYSHGPLVPLIVGYIIYVRQDDLKGIKIDGSWWAVVPLALLMYVAWVASRTTQSSFLSLIFILSSLCSIWFVAGWKWMLALLAPVGYLLFGLPVWATAIDTYTNPLQLISTDVAFSLIKMVGMSPLRVDSTTIQLNSYASFVISTP